MIQATVLYAHPDDPDAFEAYFATKHIPLVERVAGPVLTAMYTSKCLPNPAGGEPPYYRIVTLLFTNMEKLQTLMASPGGRSIVADHENFATGGHVLIVGVVDGQPAPTDVKSSTATA
jgi:uncharacterized protein (TIGR02118 family)